MEALVVEGDVDVDDVSINQLALVWYAVTDDFIDGGTDRFWKSNVVER